MIIRVRKESFGFVLFCRSTREYHIVEESLENQNDLLGLVKKYFPTINSLAQIEIVPNSYPQIPDLAAPIGMYLEISPGCNLNCSHCYKPEHISSEQMTFSQVTTLLDELARMGVFEIRLCGNEPTASEHFVEIAQFIQSKGFYLGINTNGFFRDNKRKELGNLKPDLVVVSIDGTMDTHNKIRGEGVYESAVGLLEYLRNLEIKCRINTVLSKITLSTIPEIAELANSLECGVSFLPFRPVGSNVQFNRENAISPDDMKKAVREIMRQRERFPQMTLLTYFDVLGNNPTYHHPIDRFNDPCPARKNGFIAFNGDFFPCDFLRYAGKQYYCGNVVNDGFNELWVNSKKLKAFQCLKHTKCIRCKFYMKSCYGGCISGSIASTGNPNDELCFVDIEDD